MSFPVVTIVGNRPQAIKMAPVIHAMRLHPELEPSVVVLAEAQDRLAGVLEVFDIKPTVDLQLPAEELPPGLQLAQAVAALEEVIGELEPEVVVVLGDTHVTLAGALAAFYHQTPVAHVEAGLRTANRYAPFPEEMYRRMASRVVDVHFAPTARARANLLAEGIEEEQIEVTGNTVIDALHRVSKQLRRTSQLDVAALLAQNVDRSPAEPSVVAALQAVQTGLRRLVLITGHRRESFGLGLARICDAILDLGARYAGSVEFVFPLQPNPQVAAPVRARLGGRPNIHLVPLLDYAPFVYLMGMSALVLTDSGSIQEEAPGLGKPVLLMRDTTARTEAVEAGTVKLVGTSRARIVQSTAELLDNVEAYHRMARAINPYGDGRAAERIVPRIAALG